MIKIFLKKLLWAIGILLGSICIGAVLLILVYSLPIENIREHATEFVRLQAEEGDYPTWVKNDTTSWADGWTDAVMINTATYDGDETTIEKALLNPHGDFNTEEGQYARTAVLYYILNGFTQDYAITYGRYWHGYNVILKPLLSFLNLYEIRWLNAFVSCICIALILVGFYKRFGHLRYAMAFLGALVFLNPIVMRVSMQFNTVFYVIMLEYIVALYFGDMLEKKGLFDYLFLISGILVAYFDLLTYPVAALGMLLILAVLMYKEKPETPTAKSKHKTAKKQLELKPILFRVLKWSSIWIFGYVGMWVGKWVVASIFTDENIIASAIDSIKFRSGTYISESQSFTWGEMFRRNFIWCFDENAILFKMFLLIAVAILVTLLINKKLVMKFNFAIVITMLIFCLMPIARYIIASNHSYIHYWFTYRECVVIVMAALSTVLGGLSIKS